MPKYANDEFKKSTTSLSLAYAFILLTYLALWGEVVDLGHTLKHIISQGSTPSFPLKTKILFEILIIVFYIENKYIIYMI